MSISDITICNMALAYLGEPSIASFSERTKAGRLCNALFPVQRDIVLQSHPWNFATKVTSLALLADEVCVDWDYLYQMPSRALTVWRVFNPDTENKANPDPFRTLLTATSNIKFIGSDVEGAYAEFTLQVIDPTLFSPAFIDALALRLAATMAQPLCADSALGTNMLNAYQRTLDMAKTMNRAEGTERIEPPNPYYDAR